MPESEDGHSNFRFYSLNLPTTVYCTGCDQKGGLQKFISHISSRIIFNLSEFSLTS